MNAQTFFHGTNYALHILGQLALVGASRARFVRALSQWIRVALWISDSSALSTGILGFTLLFETPSLSRQLHDCVLHFKTLFAGGASAILILLICSRECRRLVSAGGKAPPENSERKEWPRA
jgi:hypothetical protein